MGWTVRYLDAVVEREIQALPKDMQAKLLRIVSMFESLGLEGMREPYVKHLERSLWEMRMIGRDGISRAIYVTATGSACLSSGPSSRRHRRRRVPKLNWHWNGQRK